MSFRQKTRKIRLCPSLWRMSKSGEYIMKNTSIAPAASVGCYFVCITLPHFIYFKIVRQHCLADNFKNYCDRVSWCWVRYPTASTTSSILSYSPSSRPTRRTGIFSNRWVAWAGYPATDLSDFQYPMFHCFYLYIHSHLKLEDREGIFSNR